MDAAAGFSRRVQFISTNLAGIPDTSGVHVVWTPDGSPLYVGMTGTQRTRLLQHLTGDRIASTLHKQVGDLLDAEFGRTAPRDEIRDWLGQCEFAWVETDHRQALKAELMDELSPPFNHVFPIVPGED